MLMNVMMSMFFLQPVSETEDIPSPEIIIAFNCLTKHIDEKLSQRDKPSEFRVIWGYANEITDLCSEQIRVASTIEEPILFDLGNDHDRKMTREQALRAEARYYVYNTMIKAIEKKENSLEFVDE